MENNTEVVFDNIEQRILKEIEEAHYAIFVSVAWFTNKKLFNALLEKARNNCYVSIIIQLDDINSQCGIDYSQIRVGRSECFMISKEAELLHDKYCVIDFKKVITGSYNWTYKASINSENVVIISDPDIAGQYITRFEKLKKNNTGFNIQSENKIGTQYRGTTNVETPQPVRIQNVSSISKPTPQPEPIPTPLPTPTCPSCRYNIHDDEVFCTHCGHQLKHSKIIRKVTCVQCSKVQEDCFVDIMTKFCTFCGSNNLKFEKIV